MKQYHGAVITYETSISGVEMSLKDHMDAMNELGAMAKAEKGTWSSQWRDTFGLNGIEFRFRSKVSADRFAQAVQNKWSTVTASYQKITY